MNDRFGEIVLHRRNAVTDLTGVLLRISLHPHQAGLSRTAAIDHRKMLRRAQTAAMRKLHRSAACHAQRQLRAVRAIFTTFGLDFTPPASVCAAMENDGAYDFGQAYARMTCLLEDAAGLAAEGQSPKLDAVVRAHIAGALSIALLAAGAVLNEIKAEMEP